MNVDEEYVKEIQKTDKENIEDILALTPMQEGMLFNYLKNPGDERYFEQLSLEISGEIDRVLFEQAWNLVVASNEMLRAVFRWENLGKPVQLILKKHRLKPVYYDLSNRGAVVKRQLIEDITKKDIENKFHLREVPFRVTLCKEEENKYLLIISNHHILYDGWSSSIILKEFFKAYDFYSIRDHFPVDAITSSHPSSVSQPVKAKFKDFIHWIQNQDTRKQEESWKDYLRGFPARAGGSLKITRKEASHLKQSANFSLQIPNKLRHRFEDFVKHKNITSAAFFYSIWGILLQRYNSFDDILFDTTVSGRSAKIKGIENTVGLFIDTLPFRVKTHPDEKISSFLSRTHLMMQQWSKFENSKLSNINEYLERCNRESLFDSVVVMENYPLDRILTRENYALKIKSFSITEKTRYDLTLIITIFEGIRLNFTYAK
jgi:hypothetical protein